MKKIALCLMVGLMYLSIPPTSLKAFNKNLLLNESSPSSTLKRFPPTPSVITANGPLTFCAGDSVRLSGNVRGSWSTGDTAASIIVKTSGDYFVVNSDSTGSVISNHLIVTVSPAPIASTITANDTTVFCSGDSVTLSGNVGGVWSTGAVTFSIKVKASGDYFVRNINSCDTVESNHILVRVGSTNPPVITANRPTTFCTGDSVRLTVNVRSVWSTGDTSFSIVVRTSGDYFATRADSCGTLISNHIIVNAQVAPVASVITAANGKTSFCLGDSVILSGNVNGRWSTGDTTATIKVRTSGDYFVVNSTTCDTLTSNHIIITVSSRSPINITANKATTFCQGDSVILSGNVRGIWSTGDTSASIKVKTSGDYFVTTQDSCGSLQSNHIIVKVDSLPVASVITASDSITFCGGDSVVLSGNKGGRWSTGDTTASIKVKASGDYFVINSSTCDTVTSNHIVVKVNSTATASVITANKSTTLCRGDSITLSGNVGGKWNTGDTTNSITVKTAGDYFVTNQDSCGVLTSNHIIVQVDSVAGSRATITASGGTTFCAGGSVTLTGGPGSVWNTGDTTASIVVRQSGDYFLVNETGCDSVGSNHIIVTVNPLPAATLGANDTICQGQSLVLGSPAIAGHTYIWSTNNGLNIPTSANPEVTPLATTTYTLREVISATGCVNTNSVRITVGNLPSCAIRGFNTLCSGGTTQLCAPTGAYTYRWSTGDTTSCITVDSIGNYAVTVTNAFGCSSICSRNVVSGQTACNITGLNSIYSGQSTEFCAGPGFSSYLWSNGATTSCIKVNTAGTYSVTTTSSNGCVNICSRTLTVDTAVACSILGDTLLCRGAIDTLCAISVPGNTYYWSNGLTTPCIVINCDGLYSVTITNNGLSRTCSIPVKYTDSLPKHLDSCFITGNLTATVGDSSTLCAPEGYNSYLWSNGATTRCINVGKSGDYSVRIISGGCDHTCSVFVDFVASVSSTNNTLINFTKVQPVALASNQQLDVKAYPNPFNGRAVIDFIAPMSSKRAVIEISNIAGRKIQTIFNQEVKEGNQYQAVLEGANLPEGVYIYKLYVGTYVISKKLVLVR